MGKVGENAHRAAYLVLLPTLAGITVGLAQDWLIVTKEMSC